MYSTSTNKTNVNGRQAVHAHSELLGTHYYVTVDVQLVLVGSPPYERLEEELGLSRVPLRIYSLVSTRLVVDQDYAPAL